MNMQNNLTPKEVVQRVEDIDTLLKLSRTRVSPKLRPESQPHRPEFYVPKLTRLLLNFISST